MRAGEKIAMKIGVMIVRIGAIVMRNAEIVPPKAPIRTAPGAPSAVFI